jgi:hypothetical protein
LILFYLANPSAAKIVSRDRKKAPKQGRLYGSGSDANKMSMGSLAGMGNCLLRSGPRRPIIAEVPGARRAMGARATMARSP